MRVLFLSTEVFCTPVPFGGSAHSTKFCWALSDQKGMSYLAKKKSLTKRAYTDHKFYKTVERLYAQLCSVYARFICGGNVFCNLL